MAEKSLTRDSLLNLAKEFRTAANHCSGVSLYTLLTPSFERFFEFRNFLGKKRWEARGLFSNLFNGSHFMTMLVTTLTNPKPLGSEPGLFQIERDKSYDRFSSLAGQGGRILREIRTHEFTDRFDADGLWMFEMFRTAESRATDLLTDGPKVCCEIGFSVPLNMFHHVRNDYPNVPDPPDFFIGFQDAFTSSALLAELIADEISSQNRTKRTKKPTSRTKRARGLTDRQSEVMEVLTRHNGDSSAAAKELGITRQAVDKVKNAVTKKLPSLVLNSIKPKTQALPKGARGEPLIPDDRFGR